MAGFDDYNPFLPSSQKDSAVVVEIQRARQKQEATRKQVKEAILDKCRRLGPIQLPLPHIRRKSA